MLQLAGIVSQPDIQCRLDPTTHEYSDSIHYDYPSATLISDVLNQNLITPIFAVPSQVRSLYDGLVASIRSASVGTLSSDSTALISLIEDQYRVIEIIFNNYMYHIFYFLLSSVKLFFCSLLHQLLYRC